MQKTMKANPLTVSIRGETEIVLNLVREEIVKLMIESGTEAGTQFFAGVEFIRSHRTRVKSAFLLPDNVKSHLADVGLQIVPETFIGVGVLSGNGSHFGQVIVVARAKERTATVWKVVPKGNEIYDQVRAHLF